MSDSENEIGRATGAIESGKISQDDVALLKRLIVLEKSDLLVGSLVSRELAFAQTEDCAYTRIMSMLESLGNHDCETACILMAHLWPIAGKVSGLHDVCDGIGLWIYHCDSPLLTNEIRRLATSHPEMGARKYYEGLLETKK